MRHKEVNLIIIDISVHSILNALCRLLKLSRKPVYVKASEYNAQEQGDIELLRKKGVAFTNASEVGIYYSSVAFMISIFFFQLFKAEQVFSRADSIALKLKNEFPITSPEWQRWTNKTTAYNATSLTQVFAEYFAQHSIGDVGGVRKFWKLDY